MGQNLELVMSLPPVHTAGPTSNENSPLKALQPRVGCLRPQGRFIKDGLTKPVASRSGEGAACSHRTRLRVPTMRCVFPPLAAAPPSFSSAHCPRQEWGPTWDTRTPASAVERTGGGWECVPAPRQSHPC